MAASPSVSGQVASWGGDWWSGDAPCLACVQGCPDSSQLEPLGCASCVSSATALCCCAAHVLTYSTVLVLADVLAVSHTRGFCDALQCASLCLTSACSHHTNSLLGTAQVLILLFFPHNTCVVRASCHFGEMKPCYCQAQKYRLHLKQFTC